jgi:predicted short-subunit dehydrogenase-like oxidoreductase (DUF2520 family)
VEARFVKLNGSRLYIVGAGAVGSALAVALQQHGVRVEGVFSRRVISADVLRKKVHAKISGTLTEISFGKKSPNTVKGIVIIAVRDDVVKDVVRQLVQNHRNYHGFVFFHTSGMLSSAVLKPLRKRGAAVGSFHPLQTFPKRLGETKNLKGIWIALEGDRRACQIGKLLAKKIGAQSFIIRAQQKKFYHIAAVFASNYFVTLLSAVETLGAEAKLPERKVIEIFEPLIKQTLNNVKQYGAASALTGPIKRGDIRTVEQHISALAGKKNRDTLALYASLGRETLKLANREK